MIMALRRICCGNSGLGLSKDPRSKGLIWKTAHALRSKDFRILAGPRLLASGVPFTFAKAQEELPARSCFQGHANGAHLLEPRQVTQALSVSWLIPLQDWAEGEEEEEEEEEQEMGNAYSGCGE